MYINYSYFIFQILEIKSPHASVNLWGFAIQIKFFNVLKIFIYKRRLNEVTSNITWMSPVFDLQQLTQSINVLNLESYETII